LPGMEPTEVDVDELIEFWTLLDEDRELLAGKRGSTALGFALLLKHYSRHGRFPRGRGEIVDGVVRFVAGQLGVDASDLGLYEWSGRTIEYHRAQIRDHLCFRVATLEDQERLTAWLAESVAQAERRADRVREGLLAKFREERIEPPTTGRVLRMVRSAMRTAEQNWAARIAGRLDPPVTGRLLALIASSEGDEPDDVGEGSTSLLALIKASPGNVSLESMMTEIGKLRAVRALDLPPRLFVDVAPRVLAGWRTRAAVEAPSHLRRHAPPLTVTLLAALVHQREREITDTLVELLIATVHRIGARAERRVTNELINAFRKVTGKENILFSIAEAALVGRAQRTIFVARYLRSRELQREITEGLNVVEAFNGANSVIYYGKGGEIASNRQDEQEMTVLCLRILQAALVYVNTLMLQDVLAEHDWSDLLTLEDRRGLTPLFWQHVLPYGEVKLDINARLEIGARSG